MGVQLQNIERLAKEIKDVTQEASLGNPNTNVSTETTEIRATSLSASLATIDHVAARGIEQIIRFAAIWWNVEYKKVYEEIHYEVDNLYLDALKEKAKEAADKKVKETEKSSTEEKKEGEGSSSSSNSQTDSKPSKEDE